MQRTTLVISSLLVAIALMIGGLGFLFIERTDAKRDLAGLLEYEAPIFVWERQVLAPGETVSGVLVQTPITLPDGTLEEPKSIVVSRGNWVVNETESRFVLDSQGAWFMVALTCCEAVKGRATGLLLDYGYGLAIWCRDNVADSAQNFNCFFRVTLMPDNSVRLLWTMFHEENV